MLRKWRLAASLIAVAVAALSLTTAAVTDHWTGHAATARPATLDPFTGKYTTSYKISLTGLYYYEWHYYDNTTFCIWDSSGGGAGTKTVRDPCNASNDEDYWAIGTWSGGSWSGFNYLTNASGNLCLDDAGGASNIRLPVETCAEVGGQSWFISLGTLGPYCWWENAIIGTEYPSVTLAFGTVKDGAWIVTAPFADSDSELWSGPGESSCAS